MSKHIEPRKVETINAADIINVTARLAQLLAEEVDMLGTMRMKKVAELQQEKLFLINALESYRRNIDKHPHLVDTIPSRDKQDLEGVVRVFEDILAENHRRLLMAKEANMRVVGAITQVVKEHSMSSVYGEGGAPGALGNDALSITLNQTA